jgi:hypothetical protein
MNEALLRSVGVATVLGGECEPGLLSLAGRLRSGDAGAQQEPVVDLSKIHFITPDRSGLPALTRYACPTAARAGRASPRAAAAASTCAAIARWCRCTRASSAWFRWKW